MNRRFESDSGALGTKHFNQSKSIQLRRTVFTVFFIRKFSLGRNERPSGCIYFPYRKALGAKRCKHRLKELNRLGSDEMFPCTHPSATRSYHARTGVWSITLVDLSRYTFN